MRVSPTFVYSPEYESDIGDHVFPMQKYRWIYERLVYDGLVAYEEFIDPPTCPWEDIALVHTQEYIDDMRNLRQTPNTIYSELPLTHELIEAFRKGCGGTVLACQLAMENGLAMNIGGGLHHAFADHGEGFCYINDVAVGVKKIMQNGGVKRVAIVDCDVHQGNGSAKIFEDDPSVFTFSIHHENNYPPKMRSSLDIGLEDGVNDEVYLEKLQGALDIIHRDFKPELVMYVAGADPYIDDQLGGLALTIRGLLERDRRVFETFIGDDIPVVVTLAGGYAVNPEDTVTIHSNTCRAMLKCYRFS